MSNAKMLVIDAQMAGVAGDMFVAALLDLGAKEEPIISGMEQAAKYIPNCSKIKVKPKPVQRSHIGGIYLDITIQETFKTRQGKVLIEALSAITGDLKLLPESSEYAERAIHHLLGAEAKVHQQTPESVHLHAAGSADTIIDIIGTAIALEELLLIDPKTTTYWALPISVGGGSISTSHGKLIAPGPAVTGILSQSNLPFQGGPINQELTTPTGAALVAALNPVTAQHYPLFRPKAVGYGAGFADFSQIPNLFRLVLGEPIAKSRFLQDQVVVLETNVDDVSGETLGFLIERLIRAGAKDVTILPTTTKKNRPGHLISVISLPEDEEQLTRILISITGSLGVRVQYSDRHLLIRKTHNITILVDQTEFRIRVKVSSDRNGEIYQIKAEHDDVKRAAEQTGRSITEIARQAEYTAQQKFSKRKNSQ